MIIDLFLYNNEQDLLDVRLHELRGVVDRHYAVCASRTHQGDPIDTMALLGTDTADIDLWIVPVDLSDLDHLGRGGVGSPDYQKRERAHRDRAIGGLADLPDDALLLLSDADEIPTEWAVGIAGGEVRERPSEVFQFMQTMYGFAIDWRMPQPWPGTTAASLGWAREHGVQAMRDARGDDCVTIMDGGWHFSWLGGPFAAMQKQISFSHAELNHRGIDHFERCWREGIHSNGEVLEPVDVDDTYPRLMRDPDWKVPEWWLRPR